MSQRHVMIGLPAYSGTVHIPTMRAIMTDVLILAKRGFAVTLNDNCESSIINDARSEIVHAFVQSECTDLIFVDHDVVWPPGMMGQLLDHPVDVVGGIYPQRKDPITFSVRTIEENVYPVDPKTGLVEVMGLHTGFLRVSRAAAVKMTEHYRDALTYERRGADIVGLFDAYRVPGTKRKLGEDYSFCQRWLDLGGKCWLDASFGMAHIGVKPYVGQFGQFVDKKDKAA